MNIIKFTTEQLLKSEMHISARSTHWNTKMSMYLYGVRHGFNIINLNNTVLMLRRAMQAVKYSASRRSKFLFLAKHSAYEIAINAAVASNQSYIVNYWIPGLLTNSHELFTSLGKRNLLDKPISVTQQKRYYFKDITNLPDFLIVSNISTYSKAVEEANLLGIPTVVLSDGRSSATFQATYTILANETSPYSLQLFFNLISSSIRSGIELEKLELKRRYRLLSAKTKLERMNSIIPSTLPLLKSAKTKKMKKN